MNDRQVAFRLPGDLVEKIDEKAQTLRQQTPGIRVTRADVVRALLVRGLGEEETIVSPPPTHLSPEWEPTPEVEPAQGLTISLEEHPTALDLPPMESERGSAKMSMDED